MKQQLFKTNDDLTGLILRLTVGLILFPHGAQKALGAFGGFGYSATMNYFTETLQLPWIVAFLVIVIEFVGAIALVLGFASRIWAGMISVLMIGIIFSSHLANGFFMNWFGTQKGEGFEYHLLVIGLSLAIIFNGSGKWAIDQFFHKSDK